MIIDKSDKSLQQKGGMNHPPFLTWPHFKKEKKQGFSMHNQTVSAPFVPVFHNAKSRANPKWPLYGPARVLQKRHGSNKDLWHWDCPKCWKNRNILEMLTKLLATVGDLLLTVWFLVLLNVSEWRKIQRIVEWKIPMDQAITLWGKVSCNQHQGRDI